MVDSGKTRKKKISELDNSREKTLSTSDHIFSRKKFQFLADHKDITDFIKPVQGKIEINIEPARKIVKPGVGLISENYLLIENQNLANLIISGDFDKIVFKNCDFTNSAIDNSAQNLYFDNCNLSGANFSKLIALSDDHVYLSSATCFAATYYDDKNFKKNLKNNLQEQERERNLKPSWLLTINGDVSPVISGFVQMIVEGDNKRSNSQELKPIEDIIAPTKAQPTVAVNKGRAIEK